MAPSASEVTILCRYSNLFVIIIITLFFLFIIVIVIIINGHKIVHFTY